MSLILNALAAVAASALFAVSAFANSTVVPIDNEPPPRLIVEPPLPGPLARGVVFVPYRVENLRISACWRGRRPQSVSAGWPSAHHHR